MLQQVMLSGWTFARTLTPVLMNLTPVLMTLTPVLMKLTVTVCRDCNYITSSLTSYVHTTHSHVVLCTDNASVLYRVPLNDLE